ncbi:hypothetical protein FraQA3DRAFT_3389 [Frankia sp. QA3]|nr:hypothetical protein FraQA3DRAFT_3389 [Frankia sp. QA3]
MTLRGSALNVPTVEPNRVQWMTSGERQAFRAGYREALDTMRLFLGRIAGGLPAPGDEDASDSTPAD